MFLTEQTINRAIDAGWKPPWHRDTRKVKAKLGNIGFMAAQKVQDYWLSPCGTKLEPLPKEFLDETKGH